MRKLALICLAWGHLALWLPAQENSVRVELSVPPAETHVVGDPITLVWRFQNQSTNALAFMWEGCCRLNGRLNVTNNGEGLIPIPPAAATTAHQFAKAIRLDPGKGQEFTTFLHDWITLADTGNYQLAGHYRGVLPEQRPQVPRGVELWRGEANSQPLSLKLVSAADYLKQRPARSAQRKLSLELKGPATVSPLKTNALSLKISNTSAQPQKLNWPGAFQLWVLNVSGSRLASSTAAIAGNSEEVTILPGGLITREVPFEAALFEGEPFAEYEVFVDLAAGDGQPRVPSNDISVHWRLGARQVAELVSAAAQGPKAGLRNAPLKWLRLYLAEIHSALEDLAPASPAEATLANDLVLAARLKPFAPQPGLVNISISIEREGAWRFKDSALVEALGSDTGLRNLTNALAVRRHLGWDVAVTLRPDDSATLENIMAAANELAVAEADLSSPVRASIPVPNSTVPATIAFQTNSVPANFLVRVSKNFLAVRLEAARRLPDPQQPQLAALIPPTEIWSAPFQTLTDTSTLDALLNDGRLKSPQILILASRDLTWQELLEAIAPVLKRGVPLDLSLMK